MTDALIGHTGYVGSTLKRQRHFGAEYRSTDIRMIDGNTFDLVICAGAPAQKWIANQEPAADRHTIENLCAHLDSIRCSTAVLISTVDVFSNPVEVDEDSPVDESGLHPYGLHRHQLEKFVARRFKRHLIVRLPGLVGPGLRKNAVFDLLNDNQVSKIDSRSEYQFYPMVNLWSDIRRALERGTSLLHLTAPPISMADVASEGFGMVFDNRINTNPARYDFRTRYAGNNTPYQYSRQEVMLAIRAYAQSEPRLERQI